MTWMRASLVGLLTLVVGLPGVFAEDETAAGTGTLRALAAADLSRLEGASGDRLRVLWPRLRATPSRVSGLRWTPGDAATQDVGAAFLAAFPGLTGAPPAALELIETEGTRNRTILRYQQRWQGIRVLGGQVILSLDKSGRVLSMASSTTGLVGLDSSRDVGREVAVRAALDRIHGEGRGADLGARAARVVLAGPGGAVLAWRVVVPTVPMIQKIVCLVDAASGEILTVTDEVIR
ncbi:MAG: hypothetical protein ABIK09_15790 [Pseudomonadota bacterium]